jgi:hypothetical protein
MNFVFPRVECLIKSGEAKTGLHKIRVDRIQSSRVKSGEVGVRSSYEMLSREYGVRASRAISEE